MDTTQTTVSHSKSLGCVASATGDCIAKNDRLIAAAPELLGIVKIFATMYRKGDPIAYYQDMALKDAVFAAIAKATGETA